MKKIVIVFADSALIIASVLGVIISVLDLVGVELTGLGIDIPSVILLILCLLVTSVVLERRGIIKDIFIAVRSAKSGLSADVFIQNGSELKSLKYYIDKANEVWLLGTTLIREATSHAGFIKDKIDQGCKLKILLTDPRSPCISMSAKIMNESPNSFKKDLQNSLNRFNLIKNEIRNKHKADFEIRYLRIMPSWKMIITDPKKDYGKIIVELYFYQSRLHERPHFELHPVKDVRWHNYFIHQFDKLWKDSKPA